MSERIVVVGLGEIGREGTKVDRDVIVRAGADALHA